MEPDGGLSLAQVSGKSQLAPKAHVVATTSDDNSSENPVAMGKTEPKIGHPSDCDATNNDATLAKRLACADPAAEAEVAANATPFVTVDRRKPKKKPSGQEVAADANMSRVQQKQREGKTNKAGPAGRKPNSKAKGGQGKTGTGKPAPKTTAVDRCL